MFFQWSTNIYSQSHQQIQNMNKSYAQNKLERLIRYTLYQHYWLLVVIDLSLIMESSIKSILKIIIHCQTWKVQSINYVVISLCNLIWKWDIHKCLGMGKWQSENGHHYERRSVSSTYQRYRYLSIISQHSREMIFTSTKCFGRSKSLYLFYWWYRMFIKIVPNKQLRHMLSMTNNI